jgi:hypothetical protein
MHFQLTRFFKLAILLSSVLCFQVTAKAAAGDTQLGLDRQAGPLRLQVRGEPGFDYTVEGSTNPASPGNWSLLLNLHLTNTAQNWFDANASRMPFRFYRATKWSDGLAVETAPDFRLFDHQGRSRSLYYYQNAPAIQTSVRAEVLIFTGNGCTKIQEMLATVKALSNSFGGQGVLFWMIDSNQQDNRSNIVANAVALGISNGPPILHDQAQLVARAYGAAATPEAIAVDTRDFSIFYRGAIDDRFGSNAIATTQSYLSNALVNFLAGRPVSISRSKPEGCDITFKPRYTNLSYAVDIAPILQTRCVRCHSPGNIAPWQMTNHTIVSIFAPTMKDEILAGRMPPWHADPNFGVFINDASLRPDEAAKLCQWIDDGAPRGSGPDPLANQPAVTNFPFAWPQELGQPDAILSIPMQNIPATGKVDYRYLTNTWTGGDVWLKAAVVRPGNTRVVHHSLVFQGATSLGGLDGFFAGYVPGTDPTNFPPNTGKLLKAGDKLIFQMHYTTVGTTETDTTQLGLYFLPAAPTYALQTKSAYSVIFNIPANNSSYNALATYPSSGTLATNILLYEMSPHMHLRGSGFKFEVIYANSTRETLLSVPNYRFQWQALYRLAQPKYIPKGSRIVCTAFWDNTWQNSDIREAYYTTDPSLQPSYTPARNVGFGEQSYDEMFIGYLNFSEVPSQP